MMIINILLHSILILLNLNRISLHGLRQLLYQRIIGFALSHEEHGRSSILLFNNDEITAAATPSTTHEINRNPANGCKRNPTLFETECHVNVKHTPCDMKRCHKRTSTLFCGCPSANENDKHTCRNESTTHQEHHRNPESRSTFYCCHRCTSSSVSSFLSIDFILPLYLTELFYFFPPLLSKF